MRVNDRSGTSRISPGALRVALVALAALSVLASGCAGAGLSGGERSTGVWSRLVTPHFELLTDLPPKQAEEAAEQLEHTRDALLAAAWSPTLGGKSRERASVVVLGNGLAFEHYFGRYLDGLFAVFPRPTFILWGTPEHWEKRAALRDESTTSVLRHELVHRLATGIYGRQPRWFAEGLAQFLETVSVSEDGASVILGRPNLTALRSYAKLRSVTVSDALAWTSNEGKSERDVAGLYGMSWLLVHWMYNTQPEAFATYQKQIAMGFDADEAFRQSFSALSLAEIDKQLFEYARFGKFTETARPFEASHVEVTKRPMTGADVEAVSAQLALLGARRQHDARLEAEGRAHVERALALEPANLLAIELLSALEGRLSIQAWIPRLEQQVRQRPDDGEAWLLLGDLLGQASKTAEAESALRRATALLSDNAKAYVLLAEALLRGGRAGEALPFAIKASARSPGDRRALDTYAAVLFAVGRCEDAKKIDQRASEVVTENTEGLKASALRALRERQQRYAEGCPRVEDLSGSEPPAAVDAGEAPAGANASEAPAAPKTSEAPAKSAPK